MFQSVTNPNPHYLLPEQVEHYNARGFISPVDVFDAPGVTSNRRYFDSLLATLGEEGAYSINCYQARCAGIWDLCNHPGILDYVSDLIGNNIVCWASHFFCKLPGDTKQVPWHQDAVYWHLDPPRTVTVWLAIDDADEENAAMRFIPGTHCMGELPWRSSLAGENVVLNKILEAGDSLGEPFSNNLKAGQMSLHADMLAHGSLPNTSTRRRCGLTIRYCPPEVRMVDEEWRRGIESIICRGEDVFGYWQHHPRPDGDDVSPKNSPRNIGGN